MCLANNIMLVDDDPLSNLLHRIVLRKSNPKFKIKTFSEPSEAFRFLKKQTESRNDELPGIIFVDINLGESTGWSFIEELKKIPKPRLSGLRVFILSSSVDRRDLEQSKAIDLIEEFIDKPLTIDKIRSRFGFASKESLIECVPLVLN
ncbi:MAG: response regulator [Bacteroidetes bacterium]|nr:response regulator [Bacteroidota bacterium]